MAIYCFTKALILILSLSIMTPTWGAYRVYRYLLEDKDVYFPAEVHPYIVLDVRDPLSFRAYHGGASAISIHLISSWTCEGYTGNSYLGDNGFCPSPEMRDWGRREEN